jgi:hypothetical protein
MKKTEFASAVKQKPTLTTLKIQKSAFHSYWNQELPEYALNVVKTLTADLVFAKILTTPCQGKNWLSYSQLPASSPFESSIC